jgi:hypothetical protein
MKNPPRGRVSDVKLSQHSRLHKHKAALYIPASDRDVLSDVVAEV